MALAKGGTITLIGSVAAYALGMLFNLLVARQVGAHQYGLYVLGISVVGLVATLASLGLARAAQRFIVIYHQDGDLARVNDTIVLSLVLVSGVGVLAAGGVVLLAPAIAESLFHDSRMTVVIQAMAFAIPFLSLINLLGKMTQAFGNMRYRVCIEDLFQATVKVLIGVALLSAGWHLRAIVLAYVLPAIAAAGLLLVALSFVFPPWLRVLRHRPVLQPRPLLGFALPLHMSTVLRDLQGRTEILLLGVLGTVQLAGIYNISLRVSILGALVVNAAIGVASPMIAAFHHRNDIDGLQFVLKQVTKWLVVLNLPIALATVVLAKPLLNVFGDEFRHGAVALSILAMARFIDAATGIGGALINMVGRTDVALFNATVALVCAVTLDITLIPLFGLTGAAVAVLIGLVLVNAIRLIQIYRWFGIHPYSRQLWKPGVAGGVAVLCALLVRSAQLPMPELGSLLVTLGTLWISYLATLLLLGLDENDIAVTYAARKKVGMVLSHIVRA